MFSWHNMRTLQECWEACRGQGLETDNRIARRIGQLKAEHDLQSTFEGDNNVLMEQCAVYASEEKIGTLELLYILPVLFEAVQSRCLDIQRKRGWVEIRQLKAVRHCSAFSARRNLITKFMPG